MTEPRSTSLSVLARMPADDTLRRAAWAVYTGQSPAVMMAGYKHSFDPNQFRIDLNFGAVPVGSAEKTGDVDIDRTVLEQFDVAKSEFFAVRAYIARSPGDDVPTHVDGVSLYADPIVGAFRTELSSPAKGTTCCVRRRLQTRKLAEHGLDGEGVAIAIVDTGIFEPHLKKELETNSEMIDRAHSWNASTLVTKAGMHRIGHGTMCAYDALIAAPKATLLDLPMLSARPPADPMVTATISAAMQAYGSLIEKWVVAPLMGRGKPRFKSLVVSNSWGIFHPSLDFRIGHPGRFTDNPDHPFRAYLRVLGYAGADLIFAASNCGPECPSPVCLGRTEQMIMGANAYAEVLTVGGCDVDDERVGYSSRGPGIADINVAREKPNITAYTHFLGSKVQRVYLPDTGTSAACAVAAGCVAALRTKASPTSVPPAQMIQALEAAAYQVGAPGWNPEYGRGIIRPVEAGRQLGLIPN